MKVIALTGSTGYIATNIIDAILRETDWNVIAFTSSVERYKNADAQRVRVYNNSSMGEVFAHEKQIDYLIHCAFSRRYSSNAQIAESLDFSEKVYRIAKNSPHCKVINISSVSVYGMNDFIPDENSSPNTNSLYGMAKYASEVLLRAIFEGEVNRYVSLRLAGIPESQNLPKQLIRSAIEDKSIKIVVPPEGKGEVRFSWISVSDVVAAIISLLKQNSEWTYKIYNITQNRENYSLQEVASIIARQVEKRGYGKIAVSISEGQPMRLVSGWDSSRFEQEFGWIAKRNIDDMMSECIDKIL